MPQQPDLFPPNPRSTTGAAQRRESAQAGAPGRIHWMTRVEAIVRILVQLYLGLLVLVLPWFTFWTQNNLWTYSPVLLVLAGNGFFRGVVSGLGLLNVIAAVLDARGARELT